MEDNKDTKVKKIHLTGQKAPAMPGGDRYGGGGGYGGDRYGGGGGYGGDRYGGGGGYGGDRYGGGGGYGGREDRYGDRGGRDDDRGGKRLGGGSSFGRRKVCRFCTDAEFVMDYKNGRMLQYFLTDHGKVVPRRISGNCAVHQRKLSIAIKRARQLALIGYVSLGA